MQSQPLARKPLSPALGILLLALAAMAMPGMMVPAQAQQATGKENPKADNRTATAAARRRNAARFVPTTWQVRCVAGAKGKVNCTLARAILEARSRQILLKMEIPQHRKFMALQLPHGLDLRASPQVLVDGRKLGKATFITSRPAGVFARMELDSKQLQTMRKGKTLSVQMKIAGGSNMKVRTDLQGFAAALQKLR